MRPGFCDATNDSSPVILKNQLIVPRVSIATKIRSRDFPIIGCSLARSNSLPCSVPMATGSACLTASGSSNSESEIEPSDL